MFVLNFSYAKLEADQRIELENQAGAPIECLIEKQLSSKKPTTKEINDMLDFLGLSPNNLEDSKWIGGVVVVTPQWWVPAVTLLSAIASRRRGSYPKAVIIDDTIEIVDLNAIVNKAAEATTTSQGEYIKHLFEQAMSRVLTDPELYPYRDMLLDDWNNPVGHYWWVVTMPAATILERCSYIWKYWTKNES